MKIYYSNAGSSRLEDYLPFKIGVLISYYGLRELTKPSFCDQLFLDSGAFSAWRKDEIINLNKYMKFIQVQGHKADVICSLDSITSYEISKNNYFDMLNKGIDSLPCFHIKEPFDILKEYIQRTDYIALGGIAKLHKKERSLWLDKVFCDFPDIKFHGFGIQDRSILSRYPWYSVDSSSAHVMARFGGICTPWGDFKICEEVKEKELRWISPKTKSEVMNWIQEIGLDFLYEEINKATPEATLKRMVINIYYYENLVKKEINNSHKKIGFNL